MSSLQDNRDDHRTVSAIVLAAFCMPFVTGFLGIMPLDQSIIFEAAGRRLRGDNLFKDFGITYGLTPVLLQSLLFRLTGLNWFSYVLHAAIFNGLFAWIVCDLLRILIANNRRVRVIAALLIAWSFYPMFGTAFLDNHSFFFGFAAWWIVLRAFHSGKYHLLLWCGPLLAMGFYSKPLPAVFWLLPVCYELVIHHRSFKSYVKWITGSIAAGMIVMILPFIVFEARAFWHYTFELPFYIGKDRLGDSMPVRIMESMGEHFKLWIPTIAFLLLLIGIFRIPPDKNVRQMWGRLMIILLATIVAAGITANAFNNNTAPVFILVFFVSFNLYSSINGSIKWNRVLKWVVVVMIIYYVVYITVYNITRRVHDIYFTRADLKNYTPVLGVFLKTENNLYTVGDIDRLHTIMQSKKNLYIGDLFCLYSVSNQFNPWPISHLHDGTSYSSRDQEGYTDLKIRLLQNCKRAGVRLIIEDVTWHKDERLVADLQVLKGRLTESFGNIRVFELDAGRLEQMLNALNKKIEK